MFAQVNCSSDEKCKIFYLYFCFIIDNSLDEFGRRDSTQLLLDNSMSAGILQNSSAPINVPGSPMGMFGYIWSNFIK